MKKTIFTLCLSALAFLGYGQALKVAADGNVGVGKSTPTESLDVNGNVAVPNNQYYLAFRSDGTTKQQAFGMDPNNDIVFNRSAITADLTSSLIFATANKFIDFRDQDNSILLRARASDGFIGIGTNSPTHALTLNFGDAFKPGGGSWAGTSDRRAKKGIRPFEDGLAQVLEINPVFYKYNGKFGTEDSDKEFVGVIAQDIQEVAPYTVQSMKFEEVKSTYTKERGTEETLQGVHEFLTFDASALPYMLINAVKEQQEIIEAKEERIQQLEEQVAQITNLVENIQNKIETATNNQGVSSTINLTKQDQAQLEQNRPNPFHNFTVIDYAIPSEASSAEIRIYDVNGKQIKSVVIDHTGTGTLNVNVDGLSSGTYKYSLFVDGVLSETKSMVLAK